MMGRDLTNTNKNNPPAGGPDCGMSIIPMWISLRELIAEHFARLAADKLNQEFPGHELGIVGFLVDVSPVIAHYATEQRRTFTTRRLRGERSPRRKLICFKTEFSGVVGIANPTSASRRTFSDLSGASPCRTPR